MRTGDCPEPTGGVALSGYEKPVQKLFYFLNESLSWEEINFLADNHGTAQLMVQFFIDNGLSDDTKNFINETIDVFVDGGGGIVNFDDRVIITVTPPCPAEVIESANNSDNLIGQKIKDAFGDDDAPTLFYSNEDIFQDNPNGMVLARTIPTVDNEGNITNIKIELDNDFLMEATDLSIFATVIHENIHALMFYQLSNAGINIDNPNIDYSDLANEWTKFVAHVQAGVPQEEVLSDLAIIQHQIMGDIVLESAQIIQNYGNSKGYGVSENTAEALAWAGLQSSVAWTLLDETVKENYTYLIDYESTGFEILAIGSPCN